MCTPQKWGVSIFAVGKSVNDGLTTDYAKGDSLTRSPDNGMASSEREGYCHYSLVAGSLFLPLYVALLKQLIRRCVYIASPVMSLEMFLEKILYLRP